MAYKSMGRIYPKLNLNFVIISQLILMLASRTSGETQTIRTNYPTVRRDESVVDDYHGTKVADPYRWLEDLDSIETKTFVEEQKAVTKEYLDNISVRESIREKLTKLVNYPKYSAPMKKHHRYFHFQNTGLQDHDVLMVQESLESESRVLVDPNTLSNDSSISLAFYYAFSENSDIFVYSVSQSGSDWLTGRFINVTSGEDLSDTLEFIKWPDFSWTHDNLGVFYSRFPVGDDGLPLSENPQIYYHRLGEQQSQDVFVTDNPQYPQWFLMAEVTDCGKYLLSKPQPDFKANAVLIASLETWTPGTELQFQPLFSADLNARFIYVTNEDNRFVFLSDHNAPNFQLILVTIDLTSLTMTETTILVPEHEQNILKWVAAVNLDKLILCYFEDVKHKLEVRRMTDGSHLQDIPLEAGIIGDYDYFNIHKENNEFFFKFENLLTPGQIYRCFYSTQNEEVLQCEIFQEVKLSDDTDLTDFVMYQVFYTSKDGTRIPMYIAHKKNIAMTGNSPTFLFGYGGFNADQLPTFSPFHLAFMDYFDGVFASPNIRGGAEYGEKWHEGGMLLNKQNSFDDFQGAAEYLIANKYTNPQNLAIHGSSNGGLLVGACVNQRPDLFGIALPDVGLLDMLRFHKFTIGYAWCSEYGCSDNVTYFQNLYNYSPLHNIKLPIAGTQAYPAILVTTADHDDRVVPSHSFKYVSELQYQIGMDARQNQPFLLRVETNAGHNGDDKPTSKKIADFTDSFAFIAEKLKRDEITSGASVILNFSFSLLTFSIFVLNVQ